MMMPAIARSTASSNNMCSSSLGLSVQEDSPACVSVAIFKPRPPFTTIHLIARLSSLALSFHSTGFVRSAILKSLSGNSASPSVAVYSIWDKRLTAEDGPCPKVNPYEVAISSTLEADAIDVSWYEVSCWDSKDKRGAGLTPAQLAKGDVVHLRKVTLADDHRHDGSALNSQELLSYSCLAITKAYFHQVKGLLSCTFLRSLDGGVDGRFGQIVGLGIWQSVLEARAFFTSSPAECYWRSLGAKLGFELYEVVFVLAADDRPMSFNGKLLIV